MFDEARKSGMKGALQSPGVGMVCSASLGGSAGIVGGWGLCSLRNWAWCALQVSGRGLCRHCWRVGALQSWGVGMVCSASLEGWAWCALFVSGRAWWALQVSKWPRRVGALQTRAGHGGGAGMVCSVSLGAGMVGRHGEL